MATILPVQETMGRTLARALSQTGAALAQSHNERSDEQALQKSVGDLKEGHSMRDLLSAITNTRAAPEAKERFLNNAFQLAKYEKEKETSEANKANQEAQRTHQMNQLGEQKRHNEVVENKPSKADIKAEEGKKDKIQTQKVFDELVSLIPQVGRSGIVQSKFGGETAKNFSKFTSLTGGLESFLVEMVNRGTLSNTRFQYITQTLLPKPEDSQADISGKLEGLAMILDLDSSTLTGGAKKEKPNERPPLSAFEKKE